MELDEFIPQKIIKKSVHPKERKNWLHTFPLSEAELPKNINLYRQIVYHCAIGPLLSLILACSLNPDIELPWWRDWIVRYQLEDSGWNCDEGAYTQSCKSFLLSTLPYLGFLILFEDPDLRFVAEKTANYFLSRNLVFRIDLSPLIMNLTP